MAKPENKILAPNLTPRLDFKGLSNSWITLAPSLKARQFFHLFEIISVSLVYFWMVWMAIPLILIGEAKIFPLTLTLLTGIYVAFISPIFIHRDTLASRGLGPASQFFVRTDNLREASGLFGLATLSGTFVLLAGGFFLGHGPWFAFDSWTFFLRLGFYIPSAFFQDGLFFSYFLRRWQAVFWVNGGRHPARFGLSPDMWAILANALVFSLYHLPNFPVTGLAFTLALVWGRIFLRTPNLLAAACGHALLGTILHLCLKVSPKVGAAYLGNHKGFYAVICPLLEVLIAGRFHW